VSRNCRLRKFRIETSGQLCLSEWKALGPKSRIANGKLAEPVKLGYLRRTRGTLLMDPRWSVEQSVCFSLYSRGCR